MTATRSYFEKHAPDLDKRYASPDWARLRLRPGPTQYLERAVAVVTRHAMPTVLDVGCGTGRVGEAALGAGARAYVGIDLSPRMLGFARARLARFASVELHEADFLDLELGRTFDVVLALGLFDYLEEPTRAARWLRAHCASTLVASFTRWDWVKGPVRHFHYRVVNGCRVFDYTESRAKTLLTAADFSTAEIVHTTRRGFTIEATP